MRRLVLQASLLCAAGAAVGLGGNALTPKPARLSQPVLSAAQASAGMCQLPGGLTPAVPRISVEEAAPLCVACSALFVDARSPAEFEKGHIQGALHLSPDQGPEPVLWRLGAYSTVIVYDREPTCALADEVAKKLLDAGARDVRVLTGAWPAWTAAGAPEASGACASCGPQASHAEPHGGERAGRP
ncbi:MAG TPA: rhodanese-like domain-containing protein [Anaeromyxobacteraceae bacterium]|nr:rhodanese-like domain-containing protein [Anaeromyxobacteraceae bacterium]